jgi:hypothetical protein
MDLALALSVPPCKTEGQQTKLQVQTFFIDIEKPEEVMFCYLHLNVLDLLKI